MANDGKALLTRLGLVNAMGARATAAARKLSAAAENSQQEHAGEIARLDKEIRAAGVGNDPEKEKLYCHLLMARHRLQQARELSEQDAAKMPDLGEKVEKALPLRIHPNGGEGLSSQLERPLTWENSGKSLPAGKGEFVPPDVPRYRKKPPATEARLLPLNAVEDREKYREMVGQMRAGSWVWHVPLIRCGDQLITGSHRYSAAKEAGIPLQTRTLDDLFREHGLDLRAAWAANATPYAGWITNLDAALQTLDPAVRRQYGIDLG